MYAIHGGPCQNKFVLNLIKSEYYLHLRLQFMGCVIIFANFEVNN